MLVKTEGKYGVTTEQAGFTVLELMVATTIFAIVLLVLTVGVLSFSRDYFSSVTRSNTQTAARGIIDDVARSIQFAGSASPGPTVGNTKSWCIDSVQYLYTIGYEVSDVTDLAKHRSKYGLIKKVGGGGCGGVDITSSYSLTAQDKELLAKNMRLSDLDIQKSNNTYTIRVRVAYGDDDVLGVTSSTVWNTIACKSGAGSQFCAISDLTTTVEQRIR